MGVFRRRLRLALVLLVVVATMVAPTLASGAPKRGGSGSSAVLVVTPTNPAAGGTTYTISGSGFTPNSWVGVSIANPGCCIAYSKWADELGKLSMTSATGSPGTYVVKASQRSGKRTVVVADITFQVSG